MRKNELKFFEDMLIETKCKKYRRVAKRYILTKA